jgi:diguanylate cyclase (GGDEF)-like protein
MTSTQRAPEAAARTPVDPPTTHLFVCGHFFSEVDAAVAGDPALAHLQLHGFPARCGAPPLTAEEIDRRLGPIGGDEPIAWIGGTCLASQCRQRQAPDAPAVQYATVHFACLRQCFHLVANPDAVDAWLRAGAYLCTPGWLAGWRGHLLALGLDSRALARELFADTVQSILLLDTGHAPEAAAELAELAAYLDRPAAIEPVGLGVLRLNLRLVAAEAQLVAEQRRGQGHVSQLQGQLADAAMAMDLLAELSLAVDERDVIERMLEVFTALFAPGQLFYLPIDTAGGAGEPIVALGGPSPGPDAVLQAIDFASDSAPSTESGRGFKLRLERDLATIGVFVIEALLVPERLRQYQNLALQAVRLCTLALGRAEAVARLSGSERRYRNLFAAMQEGFAVIEVQNARPGDKPAYRFVEVNPAFERLIGQDSGTLAGRNVDTTTPALADLDLTRCAEVVITGEPTRFEAFAVLPGRHFDVHAYRPAPGCFAIILVDITARRLAERHVHHLAHHDALTSLPNRTLLAKRTAAALGHADTTGMPVSLMYCDLDHFKDINDSLGHAAGDQLLKIMAERLVTAVRHTDTVARQGGDELVVLLPGANQAAADRIAAQLLQSLAEPVELNGRPLRVTASIGVGLYPRDGSDFGELAQAADTALYQAKHDGRNCARFYDPSMKDRTLARVTLLTELREALQRGELRTWYQPKVALAERTITGYEALIRWQHPLHGLLLPDRFIPTAEETDVIIAIGDWILADVCRQLGAWRARGWQPPSIAVNIAGAHFRRAELPDKIEALLQSQALPPSLLLLELTEYTLLNTEHAVRANVEALRDLGVRLAIDDFGTGYSNLSYLKRLPVAEIKIDKSFVRDLETDEADRVITQAVISIGKHLGVRVVAEGVETERQLELLRTLGCRHGQGWLFGRPVPAESIRLGYDETNASSRGVAPSPDR